MESRWQGHARVYDDFLHLLVRRQNVYSRSLQINPLVHQVEIPATLLLGCLYSCWEVNLFSLYFIENQYFKNYFLKSRLPFWVIALSRCKPLKFQKMKKLIFSTVAIGVLAITSNVLSSDVDARAQDASFSNQSEESSACKHGQCYATAKSTGYRCRHCVSNAGDSYCWQHK